MPVESDYTRYTTNDAQRSINSYLDKRKEFETKMTKTKVDIPRTTIEQLQNPNPKEVYTLLVNQGKVLNSIQDLLLEIQSELTTKQGNPKSFDRKQHMRNIQKTAVHKFTEQKRKRVQKIKDLKKQYPFNLTIPQLAELSGLSESTLYQYSSQGLLK